MKTVTQAGQIQGVAKGAMAAPVRIECSYLVSSWIHRRGERTYACKSQESVWQDLYIYNQDFPYSPQIHALVPIKSVQIP